MLYCIYSLHLFYKIIIIILKYGPGWPIGPHGPLVNGSGSFYVAHLAIGLGRAGPLKDVGPPGRSGLGRAGPFDSSSQKPKTTPRFSLIPVTIYKGFHFSDSSLWNSV